MEEILQIISTVGFPIAVTIYLLIRLEGKLDSLECRLKDIKVAIAKIL